MPVVVTLRAFRQSMLDCDIYIWSKSDNKLRLFRKKGQPLDVADLDRLEQRGIGKLLVSRADQEEHRRRKTSEICRNTSISPSKRYTLIRDISQASFEAAYRNSEVDQMVDLVRELGPQLTDVLSDNDLILSELFSLMHHDDCTYTHSINVATYAMLLAKHLEMKEQECLGEVATGALLHDVGKRHIELAILNKPGRLEHHERQKMSEHPKLGFEDTLPRGDLTWEQLMMIYQHHEHYDGGGYPVGIPASEIHDLARVTTVADVFHALTSARPYRKSMRSDEACEYLSHQSGKLFDPDMTKCWISKIKATASG